MKIGCNIIKDLLPLYAEQLVSEESMFNTAESLQKALGDM